MAKICSSTVLITGASSGIGASIALAFAKKGAALSLTGRNKENLSKVAQQCKDLGAKNVVEIIVDLGEKEGVEKVVKETLEVYDKLDVLVNNAGIAFTGTIENTKFEEFNSIFNVNLRAPFFLTQMCIPYLEKSKGNVVNISSIGSKVILLHITAYSVLKAGLDHFTKTAALELSAKGIRVNAVNPGAVRTSLFRDSGSETEIDQLFNHHGPLHPLGKRNVEADEVADAVCFLSSDAAKMITGVCLNVDGGRVLTGQ